MSMLGRKCKNYDVQGAEITWVLPDITWKAVLDRLVEFF